MTPENDNENPFIAILQGIERLANQSEEEISKSIDDYLSKNAMKSADNFDNEVLGINDAEDKEYKPEDLIIWCFSCLKTKSKTLQYVHTAK